MQSKSLTSQTSHNKHHDPPGLKSTISLSRLYSLSSMLSTFRGTTNFCSVVEATVATPELALVDRITLPVLPSNSMSVGDKEEKGKGWIYSVRSRSSKTRCLVRSEEDGGFHYQLGFQCIRSRCIYEHNFGDWSTVDITYINKYRRSGNFRP